VSVTEPTDNQMDSQAGSQMVSQTDSHQIEIVLSESVIGRVYAGSQIVLQVLVSCPAACDLRGDVLQISTSDALVQQVQLTSFDGALNATDEFVIQAPIEPGEYVFSVAYIGQPSASSPGDTKVRVSQLGALMPGDTPLGASLPDDSQLVVSHASNTESFALVVLPHTISLALWDAPFPVVLGSMFSLKAGAKCSAGCKLTGEVIEVYDQHNQQIAVSKLSEHPWPGTEAMHWTELTAEAPDTEDYYKWQIRCPEPNLQFTHSESSQTFSFRTALPPEHTVTVEVISQDLKAPIKEAMVLFFAHGTSYRGFTDAQGVARINMPKGEYDIAVAATDYREWENTLEVAGDQQIQVAMSYWPEV
jgi:hypothetical protein